MKKLSPNPRKRTLLPFFLLSALPSFAGNLLFWEDLGNLTNGDYQSSVSQLRSGSSFSVVSDPLNSGRGDVLRLDLSGGPNTDFTRINMTESPFEVSNRRLWDSRIVPGDVPYLFSVDIHTPANTTMRDNDGVEAVLRFRSTQNTTNSDGDRIEVRSFPHTRGSALEWERIDLRGTIPLVDQSGNPIDTVEAIVFCVDGQANAQSGTFVYIDNINFSVRIPGANGGLQQGSLALNPGSDDANSNGLIDYWENFYGAQNLNPQDDTDGDGRTNAQEAAAGTDPFDSGDLLYLRIDLNANGLDQDLCWPLQNFRSSTIGFNTDLGTFQPIVATPTVVNGENRVTITPDQPRAFYSVSTNVQDNDNDLLPDFIEALTDTSSPSSANSISRPRSYDLDNDGIAETTIGGDLATYNEIYRLENPGERPTESQASRFLMQATFGPTLGDIRKVQDIGYEAWIDEQFTKPEFRTLDVVQEMADDISSSTRNPWLIGYHTGDARGNHFMDGWIRAAVVAEDELRQRVAFALSQIVVASRAQAGLTNAPRGTARYYDLMVEHAFGNYEDLLRDVSLSTYMGFYLSSLGNQQADPSIGRFPDENYAREVMQLFTIGLFELNNDGTRKLDTNGEPIETYDTDDITEYARIFTGLSSEPNRLRANVNESTLARNMSLIPSAHDFGRKVLLRGQIVDRNPGVRNGLNEINDALNGLFTHPNTAPFICRQLIQFLVTSNPTPAFVERVANVFIDNGLGERGDLKAVVKAILLDEEARDPSKHLENVGFGYLREPLIRYVHLAKIAKLDRFPELHFWDFGNYRDQSLQEPMNSPSVFNYYRPDFRLFGVLAENQLDSPAFGIVDGYSSISFPNVLWELAQDGLERNGNYDHSCDWSDLDIFADDVDALLDRVSLLFCAGTLKAESRDIIRTQLLQVGDRTRRTRLAAYLALMAPEGAALK